MKKEALGVDIGNVIINHRLINKEDKTLLEERYSTIPATDNVFDCLRKLNDEKFHGDVFLISKCTAWAREKILAWLDDNDFYNKTGVKPENVFFCQERSEKEKICRENNITYFVDDRLEVLSYMIGAVLKLFLFQPEEKEVREFNQFLPKVTKVENWSELVKKILPFKSQLKNRSGQMLDYTYSDSNDFSELKDIKVQGVHAFCFYKGKMVVVWSDKKNYWTPPGGAIEVGETIEEAIIREVKEETNMRVIKQIPIGFIQIAEPQGLVTQTRSFCLVEPYGDFISDPDGDINKIELIDPKDYKKYFDWGEGGDYLIKKVIEILSVHN